jgi:hypothetical protein
VTKENFMLSAEAYFTVPFGSWKFYESELELRVF